MKHTRFSRTRAVALALGLAVLTPLTNAQAQKKTTATAPVPSIDARVEALLAQMTLEEKIGQLNQMSNPPVQTGPVRTPEKNDRWTDPVCKGQIGSILNAWGVEFTRNLQKIAVEESRLKIPLIFGVDIIHGYKTIFPIPLGEAASWDLDAIEKSARVAATESAAAGIHWTFAPMVDVARDPRWGRVAEGAGEDPWLGSKIAYRRVKGFQGDNLANDNTILACAKHFAAYGLAEAGRDYNTTDLSERYLREVILPPFKACVDAGVGSFMSSFNAFNGTPATASKYLQTDILRGEWKFKGFVVSDWASITEMVAHGAAANNYEAADLAFNAGVDMDMQGKAYQYYIAQLLKDGKVSQAQIDEAVRRVLRIKFQLGLFDDPYRYCDAKREQALVMSKAHLEAARDVARKSIVLLKNSNNTLPLSKTIKTIAVIGPLADDQANVNGTWAQTGDYSQSVTLLKGIKEKVKNAQVLYAKGCDIESTDRSKFDEAISTARKADVVILALGEAQEMSGEARSRTVIDLPGVQAELAAALAKTGKPVIVTLSNGRPLTIAGLDTNAGISAIVENWFLGTQSGHAIADVLLGDYNPSGKLTITFPYTLGQIPIYYSHLNTGRPTNNKKYVYNSHYLDAPTTPLYPFGYGLSYTTFKYGAIKLGKDSIKVGESLTVSVDITNTGKYEGKETAQLYIRDLFGYGVARPVKELKGFQQITLKPGETKTVSFTITTDDLSFYRKDMSFGPEKGKFKVFVGSNSRDVVEAPFRLY